MATKRGAGNGPARRKSVATETLEHLVEAQRNRIEELERINEMHVRAEELSRQERLDADRMREAQERLQSLSERERRDAEEVIRAQETLRELSEHERREAEDVIKAQQKLQALSDNERREADKLLAAHDRIEMLTVTEIKQRDAILAAMLEMNAKINFLQSVDELLDYTLSEAVRLFQAYRGFIARYDGAEIKAIARSGFACDFDPDRILADILSGKTVVGMYAKLTREGRTVGIIYLEKTAGGDGFTHIDHEFLGILASQLSVGFNNALLFNRLRQQNRELRRMMMLKNNFIEHLSTDLQKPLVKLVALLHAAGGVRLDAAIDLSEWLQRTVDKVISISGLQQEVDEMYLHRISIDKMIRDIVSALDPEITRRKLEIIYEFVGDLVPFEGNQDIIYTIMDEVICNAIVYNRNGGTLRILVQQDLQHCHVTVCDIGIGIKSEELDKVFERFYRSGTSYDLYSRGAGLGLYIVRSFIEAYGGRISLSSIPDKGTEVSLEFPV